MARKSRIVTALREAAEVVRCHAGVVVGPRQNLASHCHNMLNMLLVLYPGTPSIELIKAVQWHDVPERWIGDIPAPAKRRFENLDDLEQLVFSGLGIGFSLTADDARWLNALDKVEFLLWCKDQLAMGNSAVHDMYLRVVRWIDELDLPPEVRAFVEEHEWERLPDDIPCL